MNIPKPPAGARPAGAQLWRSVMGEYELAEHELALLRQAVAVVDMCTELQATVDTDGALLRGPDGIRTHPALVELRQQRILLARLVVALRVPIGDQEQEPAKTGAPRLQRRGLRGAYRPRIVS
jgi:hypothetical protein